MWCDCMPLLFKWTLEGIAERISVGQELSQGKHESVLRMLYDRRGELSEMMIWSKPNFSLSGEFWGMTPVFTRNPGTIAAFTLRDKGQRKRAWGWCGWEMILGMNGKWYRWIIISGVIFLKLENFNSSRTLTTPESLNNVTFDAVSELSQWHKQGLQKIL